MSLKWVYLLVPILFAIGTIGCDEDTNPSSAIISSPIGVWNYDTSSTSEDGKILAMTMTFDIRIDSTYILSSQLTIDTSIITAADTGTWKYQDTSFIRTRIATWMSNVATGAYERIIPNSSIDTIPMIIKNDAFYLVLNKTQHLIFTKVQ